MDSKQFNSILEQQFQKSIEVLGSKSVEYADAVDRLANFKVAAAIQGISPKQALAGMMAKHTYSIFSMIQSGQDFLLRQWDEKITDHINYLVLLRALLQEEEDAKKTERTVSAPPTPQQQAASVQQPTQPASAPVKTGQ